ncbi:hypothetical protein QTO34_014344, partial [Cnephaeus nilssonii]
MLGLNSLLAGFPPSSPTAAGGAGRMGGVPPALPAHRTQPASPRIPNPLRPLTQLPLWPCAAATSDHPDPPRTLLLLLLLRAPPTHPPHHAPPTATTASKATAASHTPATPTCRLHCAPRPPPPPPLWPPLTLPATTSEATMAAICKLTAILFALIGCGQREDPVHQKEETAASMSAKSGTRSTKPNRFSEGGGGAFTITSTNTCPKSPSMVNACGHEPPKTLGNKQSGGTGASGWNASWDSQPHGLQQIRLGIYDHPWASNPCHIDPFIQPLEAPCTKFMHWVVVVGGYTLPGEDHPSSLDQYLFPNTAVAQMLSSCPAGPISPPAPPSPSCPRLLANHGHSEAAPGLWAAWEGRKAAPGWSKNVAPGRSEKAALAVAKVVLAAR